LAVPARPTASSRSSVSGVATRVSARTFEYDSSPREERLRQARQRPQRARDAYALTRGAGVEPDPPREPVGARAKAVGPPAARVELADQVEQACRRSVEMCRELRDLIAKALELRDGR
jgi:hypothetical protein